MAVRLAAARQPKRMAEKIASALLRLFFIAFFEFVKRFA